MAGGRQGSGKVQVGNVTRGDRPRPRQRARSANPARAEAASLQADIRNSVGQPLDGSLRIAMEVRQWSGAGAPARFAASHRHRDLETGADKLVESAGPWATAVADFSMVRLHSDSYARSAAQRLRARAFTIGEHVYTDPSQAPAEGSARHDLVAHELAHVVQQRHLRRRLIQPRLIVTGNQADIDRFIAIAEPAMGEQLELDPVTNEITAVASLAAPATSPVFAAAMHRIIDDPVQNAEAHFGVGQARVAGGAFPQPTDLTGATVQNIDIDDIEALDAGAPGYGIAALAHELTENYEAHGSVPAAGVDLFQPSHELAVETESDVTEDVIGPGRRVAGASTPEVANVRTVAFDFENYYIVFDVTRNAAANFTISNSRVATRDNVSTNTVDQYVTGSSAVPAAGAATIAAVAADVAADPLATVRIEGFTDDVGVDVSNVTLSTNRARDAMVALQAAGVARGRIHTVGLGEARPVAPNTSEANRARNRRVTFIVDRPGP